MRTGTQSSSKPLSIIRSQQTEEAYPDISKLRRELKKPRRNRIKLLWMGIRLLFRGIKLRWYVIEKDIAIVERDLLKAELEQSQRVHETTANCDQLKLESKRLQRTPQELGSGKERKWKTPIEPLMARSRPDSKMEVDEAPRANGRFNLDRLAQEQMSEDLEAWTPRNSFFPWEILSRAGSGH